MNSLLRIFRQMGCWVRASASERYPMLLSVEMYCCLLLSMLVYTPGHGLKILTTHDSHCVPANAASRRTVCMLLYRPDFVSTVSIAIDWLPICAMAAPHAHAVPVTLPFCGRHGLASYRAAT